MACGAAESGMNARLCCRVPSTQAALNSRSDMLPGWSTGSRSGRHVKTARGH